MNGTTATRRPHLTAYRRVRVSHVVAVLSVVVAMFAAMRLLALPPVVDSITVDNRTSHEVTVYLTGLDRDGWMAVGIARAELPSRFEQVIDHGGVWILRFAVPGETGVELVLTRHELETAGWRLTVPASVGSD
jgi:hypothetical protein